MPQIRPEEFGFHLQNSTTIQLVSFIDNITDNMKKRQKSAATLVDIEKVFYNDWH